MLVDIFNGPHPSWPRQVTVRVFEDFYGRNGPSRDWVTVPNIIQGRTFVTIDHRCRDLFGEDGAMLADLKQRRNQQVESARDDGDPNAEANSSDPNAEPNSKRRKLNPMDNVPRIITIDIPTLTGTYASIDVLSSWWPSASLQVELTSDNVQLLLEKPPAEPASMERDHRFFVHGMPPPGASYGETLIHRNVKNTLQNGHVVQLQFGGTNLSPTLMPGDGCFFAPIVSCGILDVGDIVFCEVQPMGKFLVNKIIRIDQGGQASSSVASARVFIIGDNHGENGWCYDNHIYGRFYEAVQ